MSNTKTKDQSCRTFYFSPSEDPKKLKERLFQFLGKSIVWIDLLIQVKHEFNASNRDLYTKEALLAEGRIRE